MKYRNLALVVLLVSVVFAGCKKIEDALDVTFNADFVADLLVSIPTGTKADVGTFNVVETVDPSAVSTDVSQYINLIKDVTVTDITGKIINISKDVTITNLVISVASEGSSTVTWTYPNPIPITDGTEISFDATQLAALNTLMSGLTPFTVTASGTTSEDDVTFTIQVSMTTVVTANPLN